MAATVLALGTRGDVQPLALAAVSLAHAGHRVHFVTHEAFRSALEARVLAEAHPNLSTSWVANAPAEVWDGKRTGAISGEQERQRLQGALHDACVGARVIAFNLFALEGYILAEALGCRPVVLSPYAIPHEPPVDFGADFERRWPDLHANLVRSCGDGALCWADVVHCLWPLYVGGGWRFRQWRRALGLGPVPGLPGPCAVGWPPPKPRVAYLACPSVLPRGPTWAPGTAVVGFVLEAVRESPPPRAGMPFVYATMGSSPSLGDTVVGDEELVAFAQGVCAAAADLSLGVWLHAPRASGAAGRIFLKAIADMRSTVRWAKVTEGELAVAGVLRNGPPARCEAAVHHGGSGTTAECLAAGVPSVVVPLHFDQLAWAAAVERAGCGVTVDKSSLRAGTFGAQLVAALRGVAGNGAVREAATGLRRRLTVLRVPHDRDDSVAEGVHLAIVGKPPNPALEALQARAEAWKRRRSAAQGNGSDLHRVNLGPGPAVWVPSTEDAAHVYDEIWTRRVYESAGVSLGEAGAMDSCHLPVGREGPHPTPDDIVVDVGAHVGIFTWRAVATTPAGGRRQVVAVEPNPVLATALRRNIPSFVKEAPASASVTVRVVEAAAGAEPAACAHPRHGPVQGEATLVCWPRAPSSSCLTHYGPGRLAVQQARLGAGRLSSLCRVQVPCTTVSAALASCAVHLPRRSASGAEPGRGAKRVRGEVPVTLLKVDVEGAEEGVLRGVAPADWHRIHQVVVEVHALPGACAADHARSVARTLREDGGFPEVLVVPTSKDEERDELGDILVVARRCHGPPCQKNGHHNA